MSAVTQTLVQEPGVIAADLVALNLQRGRDHGLPSYNTFRKARGRNKAVRFSDFSDEIPKERAESLGRIYKNPDDVDLFVGGLSETPLEGGQLGPTFSWILGLGFKRLRFSDRFWYETTDPSTGFTRAQLSQLRNANIARLICDNSDGIDRMQVRPFEQQSSNNRVIPCQAATPGGEEHPRIDLSPWKDTVSLYSF